ncbi:MAG: glycosyltransferase family 4 protein [Opitutales bacterium]
MCAQSKTTYIVTHEFYPRRGGIATYTEEIASAAARSGLDIEVWAPAAPTNTPEKTWPFRVRRLPLKGTHDIACQMRLARELIRCRRDLRYATVHFSEPGPMFTLMWLQWIRGFRPHRLLLTFHGSEVLKFHRNPLVRPLARRLIRHADRINTLTHYTHDLLCRHFPEATGRTFLTPGALRADFALTQPAGPARDRIVILTVGRLHPRKGQLQTLQALLALPAAPRARIEYWLVSGESRGPYEQQLRALAARADFQVKFLGNLNDQQLDDTYDQADIFAMTSINHGRSIEGFGLVYLEASAHGLPVVAHAVGGVGEAVVDGVTGLLVAPERPADLTAAFARLIADPDLRRTLGQAGRLWARRNRWESSAALLFGLADPVAVP